MDGSIVGVFATAFGFVFAWDFAVRKLREWF